MVRQPKTINNKLKKINAEIINFKHPILRIKKLYFLKGKSWALAWALNKVEHDKRGDQRNAYRKKTQ